MQHTFDILFIQIKFYGYKSHFFTGSKRNALPSMLKETPQRQCIHTLEQEEMVVSTMYKCFQHELQYRFFLRVESENSFSVATLSYTHTHTEREKESGRERNSNLKIKFKTKKE